MPKGRGRKTPQESKQDSLKAILTALNERKNGKRFSELKSETGFHQSTLSARLKELISNGSVEYNPIKRVYKISHEGIDDYETRRLIDLMEKSSMLIVGGPGGGSLDPDEDLIIKSSVAYSYPAIKVSSLGYLKRIIHKYLMLHLVHDLARRRVIDARYLTGEKPLSGLVDQLRENLGDGTQVLAFKVDVKKVSRLLGIEYLQEVVRLAEAEQKHSFQYPNGRSPRYTDIWRRYALQERALDFLADHGRTSLSRLSETMEVDPGEAESILDRLLVREPIRGEMIIYDETGEHVRTVELGADKEIKIPGEAVVKISQRQSGGKPLLAKFSDGEEAFYEILENG